MNSYDMTKYKIASTPIAANFIRLRFGLQFLQKLLDDWKKAVKRGLLPERKLKSQK